MKKKKISANDNWPFQSIIPSTDAIQLTLTLKMTTTQVVETSVTVNNNSPIQDYVHPDDQTQPTFEMTPGFKPFTELEKAAKTYVCVHCAKRFTKARHLSRHTER